MSFSGNPGATDEEITGLTKSLGVTLAEDFLNYLRRFNGGEGFIGSEYLILWKSGELSEFNRAYEVRNYLSDVVLFGSNGGGEAYGFRTSTDPWEIVQGPFVGMSPELCETIARSFSDFIKWMESTSKTSLASRASFAGWEVFEIKPIIVGGSPTDPANKTFLTRQDHIKAVVYWNRTLRQLRQRPEG